MKGMEGMGAMSEMMSQMQSHMRMMEAAGTPDLL